MDPLAFSLLDGYQRGLPLVARPFAAIARALGTSEEAVIACIEALHASGKIARVGAVFAPGRLGAATLAALAVPEARLAEVAAQVSAYPEVNHNYERAHHWNLWFVVTAPDALRVERVLEEIESRAGCGGLLRLPMIEGYHIDLGFPLGEVRERAVAPVRRAPAQLDARGRALAAALQEGLAIVPRPYAALAARAGLTEDEAIARLQRWLEAGIVKRLGLVVRHPELGYRANAMVVWDVPDDEVAARGRCVAAVPYVTLCYRRARARPHWPYNLYCMIHGRSRTHVLAQVAQLDARCELAAYPREVLFSRRRFKHAAARYVEALAEERIHG
jgi:DNA-binding Lrp family transcriptional regulator